MKEGAWIEAKTGAWHWIDDHADWIRRPANARRVGLAEAAAVRFATMSRRQISGPERNAILIAAMREGSLIRFRGHGAYVTFEATLTVEEVLSASAAFMAACLGPLTQVCINQLPTGPQISFAYQELGRHVLDEPGAPAWKPAPSSSAKSASTGLGNCRTLWRG